MLIAFSHYSNSQWYHLLVLIIWHNASLWIIPLIVIWPIFYILTKEFIIVLRPNILSIFDRVCLKVCYLLLPYYLTVTIEFLIILSKICIDLFKEIWIGLEFHAFFLIMRTKLLVEGLNSSFFFIFIWILLIYSKMFNRIDTIQSASSNDYFVKAFIL